MADTREVFLERLLRGYSSYYDVETVEESAAPLVATAFFHVHSANYLMFKEAEIWSADCNEFIYVFSVPHLTREVYEACLKTACEDGMPRIQPDKNHMCSHVCAVFVCDTCEVDAEKALRHCRIRKSFQFSLQGWMEVQTAAVNLGKGIVIANYPSGETAKYLKNVLHGRRRGTLDSIKKFLEILKD